jgi:hypothetical protein
MEHMEQGRPASNRHDAKAVRGCMHQSINQFRVWQFINTATNTTLIKHSHYLIHLDLQLAPSNTGQDSPTTSNRLCRIATLIKRATRDSNKTFILRILVQHS